MGKSKHFRKVFCGAVGVTLLFSGLIATLFAMIIIGPNRDVETAFRLGIFVVCVGMMITAASAIFFLWEQILTWAIKATSRGATK